MPASSGRAPGTASTSTRNSLRCPSLDEAGRSSQPKRGGMTAWVTQNIAGRAGSRSAGRAWRKGDGSPRLRSVVVAAGIIAVVAAPVGVAATGDALKEGVRNGTATKETQIISSAPGEHRHDGRIRHPPVEPLLHGWWRGLRLPHRPGRLGGQPAAEPLHPREQPRAGLRVRVQRHQGPGRRSHHSSGSGGDARQAVRHERHGRRDRPERRPRRRPERRRHRQVGDRCGGRRRDREGQRRALRSGGS